MVRAPGASYPPEWGVRGQPGVTGRSLEGELN
jgi:hypothetical protein